MAAARCELAAVFLEDLRRIDAQIRETRKKLATAVQAAGTSLTGLFGVGLIVRVPLDEGALTGQITAETTFPDGDPQPVLRR